MRVLYKSPSSCAPEDYTIIGRSADEIDGVIAWGIRNAHCDFGLGVLAAMNYMTCNDDKTPGERQHDKPGIRKAAEPPEWVKQYIATFGTELLSEAVDESLAFRGGSES